MKTASANAGLRAYLQKLQVGSYATPADNALRIRLQRLATLGTYQHRHIMPPTVAQTAPAFADLAAELPAVAGANVAHRAEYDDRSVVLPKLPPLAQDFHDELHGYKSADIRAYFQQLDDDWTRSVLFLHRRVRSRIGPGPRISRGSMSSRSTASPSTLRDPSFSRSRKTKAIPLADLIGSMRRKPPEQDLPSQPPQAPLAFDDGQGSRDFTEKLFWTESDVLLGTPIVPFAGWSDESTGLFAPAQGTLAALVILDELVNAPTGGGSSVAAPRTRGSRLGFSISAFR